MILSVSEPAIDVRGLRKSYGDFEAVRGIDFQVKRGEVFGLLGPNGAGKTTTVEILEGYRTASAGEVSVLGFEPGSAGTASFAPASASSSRAPACTCTSAAPAQRLWTGRS